MRFVGFVALACVSCTLLVDTGDLSGGPARPDGGGAADGGTSTGAFTLALGSPTLAIPNTGASATIAVSIVRASSFTGAVDVSLTENAFGLSAAPLAIDAAATTGTLTIASSASGMLGTVDLDVRATAGADRATAKLSIHVGQASGTLDTSYGDHGFALLAIEPDAETRGYNVVVQPDGKPLIGGDCVSNKHDFFVARTLVDGTPDPAFGSSGKVAWDFGDSVDYGTTAALMPDGKIMLAGAASSFESKAELGLARLDANGQPDNTFGHNGEITESITGGYDTAHWSFADGDKLLVAGNRFFAVRFGPDGLLDPSYGAGGKAFVEVGSIEDSSYMAIRTAAGGLLLAGYTTVAKNGTTNDHDWAIARITADGKPDSTFGNGGRLTLGFGSNIDEAGSVVETPDGHYLVTGQDGDRGILVRLTANGQVDSTFGTNGYVFFTKPGVRVYLAGVLLQGDRIVVAGGEQNAAKDFDTMFARLDANGALDPTFGNGGKTVFPIGTGDDFIYDIKLAPNGAIYGAGEIFDSKVARAVLLRIWP